MRDVTPLIRRVDHAYTLPPCVIAPMPIALLLLALAASACGSGGGTSPSDLDTGADTTEADGEHDGEGGPDGDVVPEVDAPSDAEPSDTAAPDASDVAPPEDADASRDADVDVDADTGGIPCETIEDCPRPHPGPWSECIADNASCLPTGTQTRQVGSVACERRQCVFTPFLDEQSCEVEPTGQSCTADDDAPGFCTGESICVPRPPAPTLAVLDAPPGRVRLRITHPRDAEALVLYRDDARLAEVPPARGGTTDWDDVAPSASIDAPAAPLELDTTRQDEGLLVTFTLPDLPAGPPHRYHAAVLINDIPSLPSDPVDASARGPAPDGVRVLLDGVLHRVALPDEPILIPWFALPSGSYEPVTTEVGLVPSEAWVQLELLDWEPVPGPAVRMEVLLENFNGRGASAATDVRAIPGDPVIEWQRTSGSDTTDFAPLAGLDTESERDLSAPANGESRRYRVRLHHPAGEGVSEPADGARIAAPWGRSCTTDADCAVDGVDSWCPFDSIHRRCVPRVRLAPAVQMAFQWIPAGTYMRGSPTNELGREINEDRHEVILTRPFAISRREVTITEWQMLADGQSPRIQDRCNEGTCPASNMTFVSALAYANALSDATGLPACYDLDECALRNWRIGSAECPGEIRPTTDTVYDCAGFRLCTEAEWEYAVRAGRNGASHAGEAPEVSLTSCVEWPALNPLEWYCHNQTAIVPVGGRAANPWGIYDGLGNLRELTWDVYRARLGTGVRFTDPASASIPSGSSIVVKSAGLTSRSHEMRFAVRSSLSTNVENATQGIRLCRTMPSP